MSSFWSVYLRLAETAEPPLLAADTAEGGDATAVEAFRRGLHLRSTKEPDVTFWGDLKRMACEDRMGLAAILQVPPATVGRWASIIDAHSKTVSHLDAHRDGQQPPQVIPTGHRPAKPPVAVRGDMGDSNAPPAGPI